MTSFTQVFIIYRRSSFENIKKSLADIGGEGLTATQVPGGGKLSSGCFPLLNRLALTAAES